MFSVMIPERMMNATAVENVLIFADECPCLYSNKPIILKRSVTRGGCMLVCPTNALSEKESHRESSERTIRADKGIHRILNIGEASGAGS